MGMKEKKRIKFATSKHHNIAIVPYMEGQSIGNVMKIRFVQTDEVYSIQLPDPDYHINLNLKGFKKVLAKTSEVENLFLYGSFLDFKIQKKPFNKCCINKRKDYF